jgi:hypothetical protein
MVAHEEFVQRTYIAAATKSSFTVRHEFVVGGELRMRASMTHVALSLITREKQPVPDEIRAAIVRGDDLEREGMWRAQLAAASLTMGPDDLRMLKATDHTVGPLRDALAEYDLTGVAPEAVLDYGTAPAT